MSQNDVVITGIGLVSSLGEGNEAHWRALTAPDAAPVLETERFQPYTVHPLPAIDWSLQIAKRGDQRQMETWQRLGTYAAGLALDDAGIKSDEALCASMDMVVAAGGGERDTMVDDTILEASRTRNDRGLLLNEKLTTELRPTLFLAQLSNLLAGNISIVHKVTGSSRTFMGEESAGIAAVETAAARIRSGQSTHVLVGGAFQTEHREMLMCYELGSYLEHGPWRPIWQRGEGDGGGGVITGSGSAFLVLESRAHAQARGATIYARLASVASERVRRGREDHSAGIEKLIERVGVEAGTPALAISATSGARQPAAAERVVYERRPELSVRAFTGHTGHLKEAQFPFGLALAALAMHRGEAYPPFDPSFERDFSGSPASVLVTAVGYHHFEGAALITPAG